MTDKSQPVIHTAEIVKAPESIPAAGIPQLPLPARQFQRFILLFHIVFLAGMGFILFSRWQRAGAGWGWPEVNVTLLVAAQAGIYIRFFAWPLRSPAVIEWWGFYFPVSFALWFITWRYEPGFEWIVLGYLGQLFGVVPPKYSVPAGLAVFLVWLPVKTGWVGLVQLTAWEWIGYSAAAISWTALGLFLHKLVVTSAERARLITELETAKREIQRARERDAELVALRERERLARDLHDSLGHGLVTLTVQLEAAQKLLASDPARASSLITEMKSLTRTSMEQLRRSLAGLRTPGLGERPLAEALEGLCSNLAGRTQLKIERSFPTAFPRLSPAAAEALWRVAQEGLLNVERHAQATEARVLMKVEENSAEDAEAFSGHFQQVRLRVEDNGIGMPSDAEARPGHYGLRGLRERVEGLGGALSFMGNQSRGSVLEARVPLLPGT